MNLTRIMNEWRKYEFYCENLCKNFMDLTRFSFLWMMGIECYCEEWMWKFMNLTGIGLLWMNVVWMSMKIYDMSLEIGYLEGYTCAPPLDPRMFSLYRTNHALLKGQHRSFFRLKSLCRTTTLSTNLVLIWCLSCRDAIFFFF